VESCDEPINTSLVVVAVTDICKEVDTPGKDRMLELIMEFCGGPIGILLLVVATTGVSRVAGLDVKRGNTASELEVGG